MGLLSGLNLILAVIGVPFFFGIGFTVLLALIYVRELLSKDHRPPIVGTSYNQLIHFKHLFDYHTSLAKDNRTFRLVTPSHSDIYTADPANVEHILKTKFSIYGKGAYNFDIMNDLFGEGIFAVDGEKWRHQRKLASYEFSTKVLRDFSSTVFRTNTAKLASIVSVSSAAKQVIDLQGDKEDILSRFIVESEKDSEKMTDKYLRDITLSFIIAGKDTSANTLTWFFYMLCKHPFVQEKIALEVREAIKAEDNSTLSKHEFGSRLSETALDNMQFLHAALTETLRLYPAVPVDGKCAEEDDILPDGFKIKKGDGIIYLTYTMGRMTYIWGDDAKEFRPERWLEHGVFQSQSPYKFTAFQAGPRICLGKESAYRQMKIMASFLLFFFRFKLEDDRYEATYRTMFTLHMDKGLHVYASSRL